MESGIYKKVQSSGRGKGTGIGHLYQFLLLARDHYNGNEVVVYIPLRIENEWAGTVRPCTIGRLDFQRMFEYIGEGLPPNKEENEIIHEEGK